jgi:hypothetical protein
MQLVRDARSVGCGRLREVSVAKRPTMAALWSLLSLFIAGPCAAQTDNATAKQTTRNGGRWILMAADADGGSARAYLANTATGDTYDCSASYVWLDTTISEVVCRPFDVTPRSTSPNKGPFVPSMLPVNRPQTGSLFVWFVNPNTGSFMGCVWHDSRQVCKVGEIRPR